MQVDSGTWQLALMVVLAICGAISTFVSLKLANSQERQRGDFIDRTSAMEKRIDEKLDQFRRDFTSGFMSQPLADVKQGMVLKEIAHVQSVFEDYKSHAEARIENNSKYVHQINNELVKMVGVQIEAQKEIQRLAVSIVEVKHTIGDDLRDIEDRLQEIEQRKS